METKEYDLMKEELKKKKVEVIVEHIRKNLKEEIGIYIDELEGENRKILSRAKDRFLTEIGKIKMSTEDKEN